MERLNTRQLNSLNTWQETGDFITHDTSAIAIEGSALPLFALKLNEAYLGLAKQGTAELSPKFFAWMRKHMTSGETDAGIARMHDVFNNVFPIPGMPARVAPEFSPWVEVETQEADRHVVVQPVIFVPERESDVFIQKRVQVSRETFRQVDPFLMAVIDTNSLSPSIGIKERSFLRQMIRSFWGSVQKAQETEKYIDNSVLTLSRRDAAEAATKLLDLGASYITEITNWMRYYVLSQENSPLSLKARVITQTAWPKQAADEWLRPISKLAQKGKLELPYTVNG